MEVLKENINKRKISLFPLFYIIVISLVALIPLNIWNGKTIYELWSKGEHFAEQIQFILYLSSSLLALLNILKNKYKIFSLQNIFWIIFMISTFVIAIEEISFLNSIQNDFFQIIRDSNAQNEINFHNSKLFQPYLHSSYILLNLFLGYFGWRFFPIIDAIPKKIYCLYFLFTALAYTIKELQDLLTSSFLLQIPIHQENFEFLMSLALFLNTLKMFRNYSKT
tara:strand:+ start:2053 stop:2721 length:669 start_codon:yes stop_codon:yes gene_type:complete